MSWKQVIDADIFGTDELNWRLEVSDRLEDGGVGLTDADFARLRALIVRTQAALSTGDGHQVTLARWLQQLDAGVREIKAWEQDAAATADRAAYRKHVEENPSRKRGIGM